MLYFIQMLSYTAVMLVIYVLFLRNRPWHQFNRFYLLVSVVLPLIVPLIQLPGFTGKAVQNLFHLDLPAITIGATREIFESHIGGPFNWIWYSIVITSLLAWQLWNGVRLWLVIHKNKGERNRECVIITNTGYGPGSFGKYILFPEEEVNETILVHEQAHVKLHHTADLIFLNLLQIVFWPNVLLIWIKKELREIHEFQADAMVEMDNQSYAQVLLSSVFNTTSLPAVHSFIIHPIKRRIMMLQKNSKAAPLKAALFVYTGIGLFLVMAIGAQSCNKNTNNEKGTIASTGISKPGDQSAASKQVYDKVDKMPRSSTDLYSFLAQTLHYPDGARHKGIEGKVVVKFIVDENGSVKNPVIISSPDSTLSSETIRVINLMPKWIPGENNGKRVSVYFTMPVLFKLEG